MLPTSLQSGDRAPTRMKLLHIDGLRDEGCSMNIYDYVIVKYIFESETYKTVLCYYLTYCVESDIN